MTNYESDKAIPGSIPRSVKDQSSELHIPDPDRDGFAFDCPDCGGEIRPPSGGHTWTCHEAYGGCGAQFEPVRAFRRIDENTSDL